MVIAEKSLHVSPTVKPKLAIVIGQGGIKPAAAIPVFELLKQEDIPYDLIVGCSGGALVGGLVALGLSQEEIKKTLCRVADAKYMQTPNTRQLLALMNIPFFTYRKTEGVLIPTLIEEDLKHVFGETTFEQLGTPLTVAGTDFQTGENVPINTGLVRDALYASACIYPFMPPKKIGNRLIVDGALSDPIPFSVAAKEKPEMVIVISFTFFPDYCPEGFFDCCDNFFSQAIEKKGLKLLDAATRAYPGKVVHIDICLDEQVSVLETHRLHNIIEKGEETAEKFRNKIVSTYKSIIDIKQKYGL
ncbi:MAG: hypothetical protein Tsb0021_09100 [Chlamydiales bacterium]